MIISEVMRSYSELFSTRNKIEYIQQNRNEVCATLPNQYEYFTPWEIVINNALSIGYIWHLQSVKYDKLWRPFIMLGI